MSDTEQTNLLDAKLENFKEVIRAFAELLTEENKALNSFDFNKVGALYQQKEKIVTAYRNMVAFFIKNQESMSNLSHEVKQDIKQKSLSLDELIKENSMLLKAKMQTSKMVMDSIVNAAKMTTKNNSTSYGSQGKYSPLDNNSNALAINRTL